MGEGFEACGFVEAMGLALKKNATETLAGEEGGGFVGGSFLRKGDTKEKPSFLIGVLGQKIVKNGLRSPRTNGLGAVWAGEFSEAGKDQFEVVGDFGDGTNGATRGADGVTLAEGNGWGDTLDPIDAGAVHAFEELAGIGAEGFGVAALAFGVKSIEGEGGLA